MSYDIRQDRINGRYNVWYKPGWLSHWRVYIKAGRPREFFTYAEAQSWLAKKHGGGYIQLRLVK